MESTLDPLPAAVYASEQVRALDAIAIERHGLAPFELMQRAAEAAFEQLRQRWPGTHALLVFCGAGNNAGDGYLVARLAQAEGMDVRVVAVADPHGLRGAAAQAWSECSKSGAPILAWPALPQAEFAPDVVVDALLGTGLARDLDASFAAAVAHINALAAPVLALDVPSGLDADTGFARGAAVVADATITFVGLKQGLYLGRGPDYCGVIAFSDLGIPAQAATGIEPPLTRLTHETLRAALPPRPRTAHKGTNGRVLVVGGGPGMAGAARLAGEAALRTGAGLVYVGTHPANVVSVTAARPEIICRGLEAPEDLGALLEMADVVVLGPGLGRTPWATALWRCALAHPLPLVLDADGLNLLAAAPVARERWVLTPHPGEAGRLLGSSAREVEADRKAAAASLAQRFGAVVVLKGARSLVAQANDKNGLSLFVCDRGNPGMATAGMGDVLSGVLGALIAQLGDSALAARAGVLLHALAGDDAAAAGERGMIASDLFAHLRRRASGR